MRASPPGSPRRNTEAAAIGRPLSIQKPAFRPPPSASLPLMAILEAARSLLSSWFLFAMLPEPWVMARSTAPNKVTFDCAKAVAASAASRLCQ